MEECLAIKPDLIFLWDEAWSGFARFSPFLRPRTAMGAAADIEAWLREASSIKVYEKQQAELGDNPSDDALDGDSPDTRSPQGQAPGLSDEFDSQVDVGHSPGIDAPGQGCRFSRGGSAISRGGLHPCVNQP